MWFECGLRLPKALRAWFECCMRFEDTRFECGEPNQPRDNVTPIHTLLTIVARGSRRRGSNVAFGSLRPFGPGSNVARGLRTRGSNVAFGSLRPFGPGLNVTRRSRTLGSNVGSLTNQEIMSHLYIHFGQLSHAVRMWPSAP